MYMYLGRLCVMQYVLAIGSYHLSIHLKLGLVVFFFSCFHRRGLTPPPTLFCRCAAFGRSQQCVSANKLQLQTPPMFSLEARGPRSGVSPGRVGRNLGQGPDPTDTAQEAANVLRRQVSEVEI